NLRGHDLGAEVATDAREREACGGRGFRSRPQGLRDDRRRMRGRMRKLAGAVLIAMSVTAAAQTEPGRVPLLLTVNPESRISVELSADALPAPAACGTPIELPVKIVNQGLVTFVLQAHLVDDVPEGVTVEFPSDPLLGIPEEARVVRVMLRNRTPVDV